MALSGDYLRSRLLLFATLHLVLNSIIYFKLFKTLYMKVFYHSAIVPVGFYITLNTPFVVSSFIYGYCFWSVYKRHGTSFVVVILFQAIVIVLLIITVVMSVYLKVSQKTGLKVYDTMLTTITIKDRLFEIRTLNVLVTGSIFLLVFELYWIRILISYYSKMRRYSLNYGDKNKNCLNQYPIKRQEITPSL